MRFSTYLARSAVAALIACGTVPTEGLAAHATAAAAASASRTIAAASTKVAVASASGQATSAAPAGPAGPAASTASPKVASSPTPEANPADVASIDAILRSAYDTISGPAGKQRDWNRFRSLFAPGARLIPTIPAKEGGFTTRVLTPEDYITRGDPFFAKNGFFEREIARRTEEFGQIAQVFSTYESRHNADDAKPFERGINSFQLMNDGMRWWIVTILWQGETPQSPIPKDYLSQPPRAATQPGNPGSRPLDAVAGGEWLVAREQGRAHSCSPPATGDWPLLKGACEAGAAEG